MDNVLERLWRVHLGSEPTPGIMLAAVSGYGRGELFPHSDIDILFLLKEQPTEAIENAISMVLRSLWDLGLQVGQSVRRLDECARLAKRDLTIFTTMLEIRPIAGDASLIPALETELSADNMWDSKTFYSAKLEEMQTRHAKFANTEYNLEPNVKNSPGGLRDIQVIGWMALRHYGVPLDNLDKDDFLTPEEQQMLRDGRHFIGQVRFALHLLSGREEDRLLFDSQRSLAELWGMNDGNT